MWWPSSYLTHCLCHSRGFSGGLLSRVPARTGRLGISAMPRLDTGDLYIWWLFGESEQLPHITGLCEVPLTCVRVPEVRETTGQFEGKGWGSRRSSGHHTPFTPTWCLSSLLCPRRSGWIVLWNNTLSVSFRGQPGRRLSAGLSIMITGAFSHAPPF